MNVFEFLSGAARKWGDEPAVITPHGRVSFAELEREAIRLGDSLTNVGVRAGMGLGLVARNSPEFVIGLFGALRANAVVMPISHQLKDQEFGRVIDLVPVAAILHDGSLRHEMKGSQRSSHGAFTLELRSKEFGYSVACGVPDAAVVRFTSGTTGSSKGVVLSHAAVAERSEAAIRGLALSAGDCVTWVLPMAYHFVVSILTYVRYGVTVVLPADAMPRAILDSTDRFGSAMLYASPIIIQMLASDSSGRRLPAGMRIVSTSSGLSTAHAESFRSRFGTHVAQLYGLIEVGLPLGNLDDPSRHGVGRSMPGYEVAILDGDATPLPTGEVGRLAVRGPGMFDAYLAPFRPRREVLVNGWFLTGDLAMQAEDGWVTVCGREKSVINAAGNKVFPEEVESVLNSFPGVKSSRAFGVPHPLTGEIVNAEVVPQAASSFDVEALRRYCYERLSSYKVPKEITLVHSLPLTDSGKVVRAA